MTATQKKATGEGEKAAPAALEIPFTPEPPPIAESVPPMPEPDEKQTGDREKKGRSGSQKRRRDKKIFVVVDEAERTAVVQRAERAGLSVAAYGRACLLGKAGPRAVRRPPIELETLSRAIAELNKIGSNINQIARALNSGHDVTPPEIQKATEELSLTVGLF